MEATIASEFAPRRGGAVQHCLDIGGSLFILVHLRQGQRGSGIARFTIQLKQWSVAFDSLHPYHCVGFSMTLVEDCIFVLGGIQFDTFNGTVASNYCCDAVLGTIEEGSFSSEVPLAFHTADFLPRLGAILIVGGILAPQDVLSDKMFLLRVGCGFRLTEHTTWKGQKPTPRKSHSSVVLGKKLLICFGQGVDERELDDICVYDERGQWSTITPEGSVKPQTVGILYTWKNSLLLLCCRNSATLSFLRFCLATRTWISIPWTIPTSEAADLCLQLRVQHVLPLREGLVVVCNDNSFDRRTFALVLLRAPQQGTTITQS